MRTSILSRYLDPEILDLVVERQIEPRDLVVGNLSGAHKSPLAGFAVEFAGHREYVHGDDPKHIDWRVYFNRDKYFVKQYELETNFVCHLLLDVSASMRYGEQQEQKLQYASRLAVTLGFSVLRQSDKISLATFDDRLRAFLPPSNSMSQIVSMTQHLDDVTPTSKTKIAEPLNDFASRLGRREIIMVFSDFFCDLDELEKAIQRLRYQHHEVVLFQVLHRHERTFEIRGMTKFKGLESLEEILLEPDELRQAYLSAFDEHCEKLRELALRNACEYVQIVTNVNLTDNLVQYLNQRSLAIGKR